MLKASYAGSLTGIVRQSKRMRAVRTRYLVLLLVGTVAVLFAVVLPPTSGPDPAPAIRTKMHLLQVSAVSRSYHLTYGFWPTGLSEFFPKNNSYHIAFLPSDQYATNDAWGHPLLYSPFNSTLGYGSIVSLGGDGKLGGVGKNSDIEERFQ